MAATSAEFHADASVRVSTPVRASQRHEYADRIEYSFTYGEELIRLLRSHGFKPQKGYTLDGSDAETDFAVLLSNLQHVLGPISHFQYDKLFDLEHEYLEYHWALNERIFTVLKGAPPEAPTAPARPTIAAWTQPAGGVLAAAAPASHGSPSLQFAAVDDGDPAAFTFRPLVDRAELEPMPDTSMADGDTDWPALRAVPWVPPIQGSAAACRSAAK
ncbi:hypothetical protein CYMTET_43077 [Cymbomonas tetramitiformis]|uniref:Uncharacterized protein n=1 Tax=Cymbomonas tetramitiformis TaxID=36881 RepID=A0AAE0C3Z8_9CHLO|nr:hypothetical protein CYMTET_43077 [Cymbomonas tetramitiformis]